MDRQISNEPESSFQRLLRELQEEHERELAQARSMPARDFSTQSLGSTAAGPTGGARLLHSSTVSFGTGSAPERYLSTSSSGVLRTGTGSKDKAPGGPATALKALWQTAPTGLNVKSSNTLKFGLPSPHSQCDDGTNTRSKFTLPSCKCESLVMKPGSRMRLAWDFLAMFILCWDLVTIPLVVFNADDRSQMGSIINVGNWTTLIYWTMDILLSFNVGYIDREGHLIMSRRSIAQHYARGWMIFDIALVGMDWSLIFISFYESQQKSGAESVGLARLVKLARAARFVRAIRLLRLAKLRKVMYSIQERIASEYIHIMLSLVKNTLTLLSLNHFIACIWFWIGKHPPHTEMSWLRFYQVEFDAIGEQYLWAFHWSMTQFTPGSMDLQPQNSAERAFALLVLVFGMLIFSSFVSNNTSALTRLQNLTAHENSQNFLLRKYLNEHRISRGLSTRVIRYIELVKAIRKKKIDESKVENLGLLSGPLRVELQRELFEPYVLVHPFFAKYRAISAPSMSQICFTAVTNQYFSKGDTLFHAGSQSDVMFFLQSGTLIYRKSRSKNKDARLHKINFGQYFCEAALWVQAWYHRGTMKALVESELVVLDHHRFAEVTQWHPQAMACSCEYARQFLINMQADMMKFGQVWDVPWEDLNQEDCQIQMPDLHVSEGDTTMDSLEAELMASSDSSQGDDNEQESPNHIPEECSVDRVKCPEKRDTDRESTGSDAPMTPVSFLLSNRRKKMMTHEVLSV